MLGPLGLGPEARVGLLVLASAIWRFYRDAIGITGYILWSYRDNGKENGNYCKGLYGELAEK